MGLRTGPLFSGGGRRSHIDESESPGPVDLQHCFIVGNLLQNGLYGLQFNDFSAFGLDFHLRKFIIEGQLLKTMEIGEAASELQRGTEALK